MTESRRGGRSRRPRAHPPRSRVRDGATRSTTMRPRSCWPGTRPRSRAIRQLLAQLPPAPPKCVLIEVAQPDARLELTDDVNVVVEWHDRQRRYHAGRRAGRRGRATWRSRRERRCGQPARPRPCNGSASTSSRSVGSRAPRPRSAATGSTAAPATTSARPSPFRCHQMAGFPAPGARFPTIRWGDFRLLAPDFPPSDGGIFASAQA